MVVLSFVFTSWIIICIEKLISEFNKKKVLTGFQIHTVNDSHEFKAYFKGFLLMFYSDHLWLVLCVKIK